tara:strand:- start:19549 stop:19842 length:294 start_codon:yes stop_codon:yes gene_type:complete
MTLPLFEQLLKKVDPRLHIRVRGTGDVGGIFRGSEYLVRITKGELNLNGYRYTYFTDRLQKVEGNIMKRGRKTIVKMLQARGVVKSQKERSLLLWGI